LRRGSGIQTDRALDNGDRPSLSGAAREKARRSAPEAAAMAGALTPSLICETSTVPDS